MSGVFLPCSQIAAFSSQLSSDCVGFSETASPTEPPAKVAPPGNPSDCSSLPVHSRSPLRLAALPDVVLAHVLAFFPSVTDLMNAITVCRAWVIEGDRTELWKHLGKSFQVAMPSALGRSRADDSGKRMLRSASNAKRTFFKAIAAELVAHRLKHDGTLSEAYTLFRMADSVAKLKSLLRSRWGVMINISTSRGSAAKAIRGASSILEQTGKEKRRGWGGRKGNKGGKGDTDSCGPSLRCRRGAGARASRESAPTARAAGCLWVAGTGRWKFDVNYRHTIYEGNTLLNFAVRCGRRNTVEFIIRQMGADPEAADDGGFTPLLNAAWRGDAALVQQLYDAGASLDVKGTSRGEGPYSPIEWAERKDRPRTAQVLSELLAAEAQDGNMNGATGNSKEVKLPRTTSSKRNVIGDV